MKGIGVHCGPLVKLLPGASPGARIHGITTTLLSGCLGLIALGAGAETLRVDREAAGCSDAQGRPYCTIRAAIDRAPAGANVEIAAGTYDLWGESLTIDKSLTLRGAGADATVLDGGGEHPGPVVRVTENAVEVSIAAIGLVNRSRAGSYTAGAGGIDHFGQRLTIADSVIRGNQGGVGGALRAGSDFGSVRLENVTLSENSAFVGGAIDFRDAPAATLELVNCRIRGNTAIFSGGGLFIRDVGSVTLSNVTVTGNESGNQGGGIYIVAQTEGGRLELHDSRVTGNWSKGAGGIAASGEGIEVHLEGVVLASNTSQADPDSNDCRTESKAVFRSLGGNLVGNGAGCDFRGIQGDSVGTTDAPIAP
jgi:hypothetical protein